MVYAFGVCVLDGVNQLEHASEDWREIGRRRRRVVVISECFVEIAEGTVFHDQEPGIDVLEMVKKSANMSMRA